jgi:hypothetical protein
LVRGFSGSSRIALLAFMCVLSACGRNVKDSTAPEDPAVTPSPPPPLPVTPPPPAQAPLSGYDASVGNGVDSAGYADLPLRAGAHRYFVSSATGSDANGCTSAESASAPKATLAGAMSCAVSGNGDQVLVAQGTRYAASIPSLGYMSGYDPVHPFVLQTYDPADPNNEAKYGRATGSSRPVLNTSGTAQQIGSQGFGSSPKYIAIRGFDFNPGNIPDSVISFVPNASGTTDYVLIEHNIFRYTMLAFDQESASTPANHLIIRGNSSYGQWSATSRNQGIYLANWASYTIEDNVFWHNGWKLGASRDDSQAAGGLTSVGVFVHPIYAQCDTSGISRRNLTMDGGADGGSYRGDITFTENVNIDNPIGVGLGGGHDYATQRPTGVMIQASYNAFIGDADVNTANPRGLVLQSANGKPGSAAHHNLIARSRNPSLADYLPALNTAADYDQPSYMDWNDNVVYLWRASGYDTYAGSSFPAQIHTTYNRNMWDDPASGTNLNIGSKSFPNPMTGAQLFAALGCTDKATCAARMIETPEQGWAVRARALLWQGYGL